MEDAVALNIAITLETKSKELFGQQFGGYVHGTYHGKSECKFFDMAIRQNLGIFAMVIKDAKISVTCEPMVDPKIGKCYWVQINLSYNHPSGGSNGSTIGTVWMNEKFEVIDIRKPGDGR